MNESSEYENLEGLFQSQLRDYEAIPTQPLWDKLEKRIPPKKRINMRPFGSGGLLILLIGVAGWLSFFPQLAAPPTNEHLPLNSPRSAVWAKPDTEAELPIAPTKKDRGNPANQMSLKSNPTVESGLLSAKSSESSSVVSGAFKRTTENTSNSDLAGQSSHFFADDLRSTKSTEQVIEPLRLLTLDPLCSVKLDTAGLPFISPIEVQEAKTGLGKWSAELIVNPHLWLAARSKNSDVRYSQFLTDGQPLTDFGILFRGQGYRRMDFEIGFFYGRYQMRSVVNEQLEFSYINSFLDEEDILTKRYSVPPQSPIQRNTEGIAIKYVDIRPPFLRDGDDFTLQGTLIQKVTNWRIPMGVNYRFKAEGKFNYAFHTGINFNHYALKDVSFPDLSVVPSSLTASTIESTAPQKKSNFQTLDTYFGVNAAYQVSDLVELRLAPTYFTTIYSSTFNDDRPRLQGLQLRIGLSYRLGRSTSNYPISKKNDL